MFIYKIWVIFLFYFTHDLHSDNIAFIFSLFRCLSFYAPSRSPKYNPPVDLEGGIIQSICPLMYSGNKKELPLPSISALPSGQELARLRSFMSQEAVFLP